MRIKLKLAIVSSGRQGYIVAREMNWPPSKLSATISEIYDPTPAEREALAEILDTSVQEIFPAKLVPGPWAA
jgi:hypothetical protein